MYHTVAGQKQIDRQESLHFGIKDHNLFLSLVDFHR